MIESPIAILLLAGLSLAGTAAVMRRRRRCKVSSLAHLTTGELEALRQSLDPAAPVQNFRRATLVVVEEEIRRRQLVITQE